jgi:hypothetical protein
MQDSAPARIWNIDSVLEYLFVDAVHDSQACEAEETHFLPAS